MMNNKYEVSVHRPHPDYGNGLPPGFYKANQDNVDVMFDAGATEIGLYVVRNDNRRFVKYIHEASDFAAALKKVYASSDRRSY